MTVNERVVLGQGSPGVVSSQLQTDPVPSAREQKTLGVVSPPTTSLHESVPTHRPPPALLDKQGSLHFHVERLLKRLRHKGQYQYLVKCCGYPVSKNLWEFEVPLQQDFPYAVEVLSVALRVSLHPQRASHQ